MLDARVLKKLILTAFARIFVAFVKERSFRVLLLSLIWNPSFAIFYELYFYISILILFISVL